MAMPRRAVLLLCACVSCAATRSSPAQSGPMPGNSPFARCTRIVDPSGEPRGGNFFPGKYFHIKARADLEKGDATGALENFEHAAYYGNKDAQYDMAMLYLRGAAKIPVDVPRGVAWLQVAAQYQQTDAVKALVEIDSALSEEQRKTAAGIAQRLLGDYSVATTQRRARLKFQRERGNAVIEMAGGGAVCKMDGTAVDGSRFYAQIDEEFAEYMSTMFGQVTVEPIQQASPPPGK